MPPPDAYCASTWQYFVLLIAKAFASSSVIVRTSQNARFSFMVSERDIAEPGRRALALLQLLSREALYATSIRRLTFDMRGD